MIQTELDVLRDVSERLTAGGISFMLTGSMAMNYYAQPRMTRDINLVVKLASEQVNVLLNLPAADYYVDRHMVAKAIVERSMFNLIHNETIIKLDCIVLKSDQYRQEEFARRRLVSLGARNSKSELQLRDVKNLLAADCDMPYLDSRADEVGVKELLVEVLRSHE